MNQQIRQYVSKRAQGVCEYCHLPQRAIKVTFHVEHIVPKKHLGSNLLSNLAFACHWCNRSKSSNLSGIDGITNKIVPLFHPRKQAWSEHFHFIGSEIIGLTPTGRATVQVLNMNSLMMSAIRQELLDEGFELKARRPRKRR